MENKGYTPADVEKALEVMKQSDQFKKTEEKMELILQTGRLQSLKDRIAEKLIGEDAAKVETNKLINALEDLANMVGIDNFFEFAGLEKED